MTLNEGCSGLAVPGSEGTMSTESASRRSSRMALHARITLSGHDHAQCPFTIPARATKLNRYGAAIQLDRELLVNSTIVLRNNHLTQAPARVVTCVSGLHGVFTYGVEFLEAKAVKENFWGINFPPAGVIQAEGIWFCFRCSCGATGWFVMPTNISFGGLLSPELPGYCPKSHRTTIRGVDAGKVWRSPDQIKPAWYPATSN